MFPGIGFSELLVLAIIGLVVIGPKNLPNVAKSLGKGYREFKKAMGDLKEAVNIEDDKKPTTSQKLSKVYEDNWKDKIVAPSEQSDAKAVEPIEVEAEPIETKTDVKPKAEVENNDGTKA